MRSKLFSNQRAPDPRVKMAALGTVLQRGLDGVPLALAKPAKPAPETGLQIGMGAVVTGTSIMAVEFDGGVIIGADSRTSSGTYVANRVSDKLTEISPHIFCCRSGSSADTQAIADLVKYQLNLHSLELGEEARVKTVAQMFRKWCYDYRDQLTAGIICAGWDKYEGGQVFSIPLGGMSIRQPFAIGGSGSTYIYGYCDSQFKKNMTKEECIAFVKNCLALAIARDGSSGGVIRMAIITEEDVERSVFTGPQIPQFYSD